MSLSCSQKNQAIPIWRHIQKTNFTKLEPLLDFLELSTEARQKIFQKPRFILNLPLRLAAKIEKNNLDDPILRQFVPLQEEYIQTPGFVLEPLEDQKFLKRKKILHKYKNRVLLITTSACAMHCRYCFRQNFPYETQTADFSEEISYIQQNPTISEVILSGGDPLSLSDQTLSYLFDGFNQIPHLHRIRFHTRFPIGIPERIDASFLNLLQSSCKQIFFTVHVNHSKELDEDVVAAMKKIQSLGIPVLNQSVLLKGVNDDPKTLLALSESLINSGIVPYYLHLLDPVQGAAHFDIPKERGLELLRYLQEETSGYGVPRLVREIPGSSSKTFISH